MELERATQLLRGAMQADRLTEFFADESLREAHLLSYMEVLEIFGCKPDYEYLPEANKKLIQSHFLLQNAVHDQLRKYQYGPLALRVLQSVGSLGSPGSSRSPSLVLHWLWVQGLAYTFGPALTYSYGRRRLFHSGNYFDLTVSKASSKPA